MSVRLVFLFSFISVVTGLIIFVDPKGFYDAIPGMEMMGPYNVHFVRDAGLAYLSCGLLLGWGAWKRNRPVAMAGALWLFLHGLFHIQIWVAMGLPFDKVGWTNLAGVIIPALVTVGAAWKMPKQRA